MKSSDGTPIPRRKTLGSAGYDFYAPCDIYLCSNSWKDIDTGISMEKGDIPEGCVMLLFMRSSLGVKGVHIRNGTGVIDADYRDNIRACLGWDEDVSGFKMRISKGDRFMQGVIVPFVTIPGEIPPMNVRTGGIGSTGK